MERNLTWNANASPVDRFEGDSRNNGAPFINIYDVRVGQGNLVQLIQHECNGRHWFAIPPSAYHLIVGNSIPVSARLGVPGTVLDQGNTHGSHCPHGMAQAYQTARPSNASAGPRSGSFHANLQHASPLQADNPWPPRDSQPQADIWTAQAPPADVFQDQLGLGSYGPTLNWDNWGTTGLSFQGPEENLHRASSQAFRHGHVPNSANASLVPERSQEDRHHPVNFSSSHLSYHNNARHSLSPGTISSINYPLHEPLGPASIQSVNAKRAAMSQDLEEINESRQLKGDYTGGLFHATNRKPYRSQAYEPVPEDERPMLMSEGYEYRDPQDILQEIHPEPGPHGLARQEARARKRSQAPRSVAGSASQSTKTRGKRGRRLTQEEKAHANRVRKASRKDCIHKLNKQKCICDDDDLSVARGSATRPADTLLQPRRLQDDPPYGSPNTQTSLDSSFFTGPATNTRSTPSRNPSYVSHEAPSTPADTNRFTARFQDNLRIDSSQDSHRYASSDNNSIDAPGDTDDEAM